MFNLVRNSCIESVETRDDVRHVKERSAILHHLVEHIISEQLQHVSKQRDINIPCLPAANTHLSPVSAQVVSMFNSVLSTTVPSFVNNLQGMKKVMKEMECLAQS